MNTMILFREQLAILHFGTVGWEIGTILNDVQRIAGDEGVFLSWFGKRKMDYADRKLCMEVAAKTSWEWVMERVGKAA